MFKFVTKFLNSAFTYAGDFYQDLPWIYLFLSVHLWKPLTFRNRTQERNMSHCSACLEFTFSILNSLSNTFSVFFKFSISVEVFYFID